MTDSERLRKLYEERVPVGMSQAEFGTQFGIGTKAMVWQYLAGYRPLNYEAAAKFAKGLRCTIADISPDMARRLRTDIIPVLGRVSVKAAIMFMLAIPPLLPLFERFSCVLCQMRRTRLGRFFFQSSSVQEIPTGISHRHAQKATG